MNPLILIPKSVSLLLKNVEKYLQNENEGNIDELYC